MYIDGECQLLHSHPSQPDKTMLIKNLLDFSSSRDQRPPGSFLPKREEPGNEVAFARNIEFLLVFSGSNITTQHSIFNNFNARVKGRFLLSFE
jgi:hypothetical protein